MNVGDKGAGVPERIRTSDLLLRRQSLYPAELPGHLGLTTRYDLIVGMAKQILLIAHIPSNNTQRLRDAVLEGARSDDIDGVDVATFTPFEANAEDVMRADALILGTTENLGYMSGALKDFFDRVYYPCLEQTQGLPYALYVRAGHDGTGTCRAVASITTGLRWRALAEPLVCRGKWQENFVDECRELGLTVAAGVEAGIF